MLINISFLKTRGNFSLTHFLFHFKLGEIKKKKFATIHPLAVLLEAELKTLFLENKQGSAID